MIASKLIRISKSQVCKYTTSVEMDEPDDLVLNYNNTLDSTSNVMSVDAELVFS